MIFDKNSLGMFLMVVGLKLVRRFGEEELDEGEDNGGCNELDDVGDVLCLVIVDVISVVV